MTLRADQLAPFLRAMGDPEGTLAAVVAERDAAVAARERNAEAMRIAIAEIAQRGVENAKLRAALRGMVYAFGGFAERHPQLAAYLERAYEVLGTNQEGRHEG